MSTRSNPKGEDYYPCPCCGSITITEPGINDICSNCDWEDDPAQSEDPTLADGANGISLEQAQKEWAERDDS